MVGGVVLGDKGRGQARSGVVGHQRAQVRGDTGRRGRRPVVHAVAVERTRRTRSAFFVRSSGQIAARWSPERGSTRSTELRSQRRYAHAQVNERAIDGGDLEADALHGDGAIASSLDPRDLGAEKHRLSASELGLSRPTAGPRR